VAPATPVGYLTEALRIMEQHGYYVDPVTWPATRDRALAAARRADEPGETHLALRIALQQAGGAHSRFVPPGQPFTNPIPPPPPTVTSTGEITTVVLPRFGFPEPEAERAYTEAVAAGIRAAAPQTGCGWIVDLRGNTGGTIWPMLAGVSALIPDGEVLRFVDRRGQQQAVAHRGGSTLLDGEVLATVPETPSIDQPVAVLQDGRTASARTAPSHWPTGRGWSSPPGCSSTGPAPATAFHRPGRGG
jgi:hypothetical protein